MTANMKFNGDLSRWEGRNIQFTFLYETSGFAAETWRNSRFFTTARRHRSEACRSSQWPPDRKLSRQRRTD